MKHKLIRILLAVFFILIFFCIFYTYYYLTTPFVKNKNTIVIIEKGDTALRVAYKLKQDAGIPHPKLIVMYLRVKDDMHRLKAGEYLFPVGATLPKVINQIKAGKVLLHRFTLVDGWRFSKVMEALNATPNIQHTLNDKTNKSVMIALGFSGEHPEGQFFPDTYYYTYQVTDQSILLRAKKSMDDFLAEAWKSRDLGLPYKTSYEALIVASMIEKESADEGDMTKIASVIINRLHKNMRLQIDPTVMYGVGKDVTVLTKQDLKRKTPYNTYKINGLPPTPICMPGANAILAALHPAKTDYIYYVSKGDGTHVFSKTLREQNEAIKKYLK